RGPDACTSSCTTSSRSSVRRWRAFGRTRPRTRVEGPAHRGRGARVACVRRPRGPRPDDGRAPRRPSLAGRAVGPRERRVDRVDLREPDAVRTERGLRRVSAARGRRHRDARVRALRRRLRPLRRRDVPGRRRDARGAWADRGAPRRRRAPRPLRRRRDGRDEALRHHHARRGLFRPEGLPAAARAPDRRARPALRRESRRMPHRPRAGRPRDVLAQRVPHAGAAARRARAVARTLRGGRALGRGRPRARSPQGCGAAPRRRGFRGLARIRLGRGPAHARRAARARRTRRRLAGRARGQGASHRQCARGYGRERSLVTRRLLAGLSVAHFAQHVTNGLLSALLPFIRDAFLLSNTQAGLAVTAYTIASGVTNAPLGVLADRVGARRVIVGGLVLVGLSSIAIGLAGSYLLLLAGLLIMGVASGTYHAPASALIAETFSFARRGVALGTHTTAGHLAFFAAPLLAGILAANGSWRVPYIAFAIAPLACAFLVLRVAPPGVRATERHEWLATFTDVGRVARTVGSLVSISILAQVLLSSALAFLTLYLVDARGVSPAIAAALFGVPQLAGLVAAPLSGILSDRFG